MLQQSRVTYIISLEVIKMSSCMQNLNGVINVCIFSTQMLRQHWRFRIMSDTLANYIRSL